MNTEECILCNAVNSEVHIHHNNFDIIRCKNCGLLYQYTPKQFEALKNMYDNIYDENPYIIEKENYIIKRMKIHYEDILEYQRETGNLLDIGCSYGLLMEHFISKGWKAMGIDISENAIKYARSKGLNCYNLNIEYFKPVNKFNVIILSHVLEHLERPLYSLSIIKKWLCDNGIIYIRVPNIDSIVLSSKKKSFIGDLKPFEHLF